MSGSELSCMIKLRQIRQDPVLIEANAAQCAALAQRFAISAVTALHAKVQLTPDGKRVTAEGRLTASIAQPCAISGEDFAVQISEPLRLIFVPDREPVTAPDEEIELSAEELDEILYDGDAFDLGEAVAQSLGLAIDPYATGPDAESFRKETGLLEESRSGPFAALAALKKD